MRLKQILDASHPTARSRDKILYGALLAALLPVAFAQFAWSQPATPAKAKVHFTGTWSDGAPAKTRTNIPFNGLWTNDLLAKQDQMRAQNDANDPANLHRRLMAERRDDAWAGKQEKALNVILQQPSAGIVKKQQAVRCASTLCEVDVRIAYTARNDRQLGADEGRYFLRLSSIPKITPGFADGLTSGHMTLDPDKPGYHDDMLVYFYFRKTA